MIAGKRVASRCAGDGGEPLLFFPFVPGSCFGDLVSGALPVEGCQRPSGGVRPVHLPGVGTSPLSVLTLALLRSTGLFAQGIDIVVEELADGLADICSPFDRSLAKRKIGFSILIGGMLLWSPRKCRRKFR